MMVVMTVEVVALAIVAMLITHQTKVMMMMLMVMLKKIVKSKHDDCVSANMCDDCNWCVGMLMMRYYDRDDNIRC